MGGGGGKARCTSERRKEWERDRVKGDGGGDTDSGGGGASSAGAARLESEFRGTHGNHDSWRKDMIHPEVRCWAVNESATRSFTFVSMLFLATGFSRPLVYGADGVPGGTNHPWNGKAGRSLQGTWSRSFRHTSTDGQMYRTQHADEGAVV